MPQSDILKRYLDAGLAFTQMTRERAEGIVQELVKAGEVRRKEAEKNIEELLERSRRNTDELVGIIRREIADQLRAIGLDDLAKRAGGGDTGESGDSTGSGAGGAPGGGTPTEGPITTPSTKKAGSKKATASKKAAATKKTAATKTAKKAAKKAR